MAITSQKQIAGGLYGMLVGDAVGVPYEFNPPSMLPARADLELIPPIDFPRSHRRVPPGTWSDDGALALCLLDSLLVCERLDLRDFAARMMRWEAEGYLAVDDLVFDIGNQTYRAIRALERGVAPELAGPADVYSNGNGALMRVLPLALWHKGSEGDLVQLAHRQCLPTHGHPLSQVCCALYCLTARYALNGLQLSDAWHAAEVLLDALYGANGAHAKALRHVLREKDEAPRTGSGYVVNSLWSAYEASLQPSFEAVIKEAIAFGNDTDTTACIAGGLAGIQFGVDGIPERWLAGLRGIELVAPLAHRLFKHLEHVQLEIELEALFGSTA